MEIFSKEESLARNTKIFTINSWEVRVLPCKLSMSSMEVHILERYAMDWVNAFNPKHKNYFRLEFNAPSSIIRFDYVLDSDGIPKIFEIEDRPAGFEVMAISNNEAFDLFTDSLLSYSDYSGKSIGICVSQGRMYNSDDYFWVQRVLSKHNFRMVLGDIPSDTENYLWLVRSLRNETQYYDLFPNSLSTIEYEGDKSYGVKMGLWNKIEGIEDINWNESFVVKPDAGCRCENVHLFSPERSTGGYSTKTKITNAVLNKEVSFIQPLFLPESVDFLPNNYSLIRRCYAVYSISDNKYKIIGGQWEARPKCHKIHGAIDAICGPLVI